MQNEFTAGEDTGQHLSDVAVAVHSPVPSMPCAVVLSQHLWRTLCPPWALLLTALCSELIALINPGSENAADAGEEAFGVSWVTEGEIPQQRVGEKHCQSIPGQTDPKRRHSALQVNYTQFAANFNSPQSRRPVFLQQKWDAAWTRLKTN